MTEPRVHRLVYLLLAVMALVAATLACSPVPQPTPTPTAPPPTAPPPPPPTAIPRPTEPPAASGNVTIVNGSSQTICYLFASLTTQSTWGDDWLGSTGTIAAGDSYSFDLTPGAYDMMAADCNQNEIERNMGVTITAAGYTWTVTATAAPVPPPSGGGNVTVVNSSSQTICYLFASLTTQSTWGDDRLGSTGTIAQGASFSFDLNPGAYDMMAMDCSQNEIERNMGVTISAAGYTWTVTGQ